MTVEQVDAQFKLVEQIHDLRAEIERLRDEVRRHRVRREQEKLTIIEECARVVDEYASSPAMSATKASVAESIAAAIRALKDRP